MLLLAQCRLVTLRLRDCDIGDAHCPQLVALLKENPSIQHLNLENNCLELLEDLLSSLGSTLPNLHALNLSDNPLSLGAAEALGRYLAGNPTLETLNLECCVLQSPAVAAVCNNLTSANTHLTLLDLSENDFDQEGVKSICAMLKCNRHLCELRLSHNSLAPQRPEDDRRLHRHRSHRRSSNSPLALLAEALRRNMTLQRLQLHECHICQGAVQPLAELLACNNTLRALGLKFNALGDGGAQCLGRQLLRNSGLQELDLRFCGLSCEGTAAVCEGLLAHTAIRVLRLDNNQIASDGLAALAQLVKTNASLRCLSLNYNSVSDWDAGLLALALRHNASLSELNLEGSASHLTGVGVRALLEAAHIHHSLRRLNVSRNDVSPAELPAEDTQQVQCFHRKLQPIHIRRTWLLFRKPVVAEGSIVFA
jgi:Ran GTPase-activating protein (RanGAP) involved in mRNA processing and transport